MLIEVCVFGIVKMWKSGRKFVSSETIFYTFFIFICWAMQEGQKCRPGEAEMKSIQILKVWQSQPIDAVT